MVLNMILKFVFEKIDNKYCSLFMKDFIFDISVCIWKIWY